MCEAEARQGWGKDQPTRQINRLDVNRVKSTLTMNSIKVIEDSPLT